MSEKENGRRITLETGAVKVTGLSPTFWQSDNYAEDWYNDALAEARSGGDHNARRREIIFAACFAESFIFEWARDKLGPVEINDHFPMEPRFKGDPRYRRSLMDRWKQVPQELYHLKKLIVCPTINLSYLSSLGDLVKYRNGLVHAAASRPATDQQPKNQKPFPTRRLLRSRKPGWAVKIVFNLAFSLCKQVGDPKPHYLLKP